MALTRLQKALAAAGVASRRKAEELITQGRVRVNGKVVTELGTKVDPVRDRIEVNRKQVVAEPPVVLLMNKPRGVVCTVDDPEGRETVLDLVKKVKARLYPVGRLDFATSGALLLTNDGALAYALTHPKHGVEKTYLLKVKGAVSEQVLEQWRKGVDIGDSSPTRPVEIALAEVAEGFTWLQVTLKEGRNRQIRRMAEATGIHVIKLKRIAFAGLTVDKLRVGQYRELTERELHRLKRDHINPGKKIKAETKHNKDAAPKRSRQKKQTPKTKKKIPAQKRPSKKRTRISKGSRRSQKSGKKTGA